MNPLDTNTLWKNCLEKMRESVSEEDFSTWLSPLQAKQNDCNLVILTPNHFVLQGVQERFLEAIQRVYSELNRRPVTITLKIGSIENNTAIQLSAFESNNNDTDRLVTSHYLNKNFTFSSFVEGKSNQLAKAGAIKVAETPGVAYNPLLLYGGVGLGKTHLLHAVGNQILMNNPTAKVLYLHSERFVSEMIKALQTNTMDAFKTYYRDLDILLIDDIQFFSGKERSQEEFFHTFNVLLAGQRQIILSCDRYPREISGVQERLTSRLGSGLTIAIEPPDLETRVAILMNKAIQMKLSFSQEVAFFLAKKIRSNIRELEGVLIRINAYAHFVGQSITLDLVKDAIKDILAIQDKRVSVDNIIKIVCEYYHLKKEELTSLRRTAKFAQARQVGMALIKELTHHSYPEIAKIFKKSNHTTVMYAVKKIDNERFRDTKLSKEFTYLLRILSNG